MATLGSSPPKAPEVAPQLGSSPPGRERAPTVPQTGGVGNPGYFTSEDLLIDDTLPMLDRVVKYATAQMALQRLVHVRMLGAAAAAVGPRATLDRLIPLLPALAVDQEFVVRKELAVQLPLLADVCVGRPADAPAVDGGALVLDGVHREGYEVVLHDILPLLSSLLADTASGEVRSQAIQAVVAIAGGCIQTADLAMHVLTIIIEFAGNDASEERRMTAVELLDALSPILKKDEMCRQFVVPTVVSLAEDGAFRVRMAVGRNIANVFRNSSREDIVEKLLPAFFHLTEDEIWGVRKACAESLWQIAKVLPGDVRRKHAAAQAPASFTSRKVGKTLTGVYRAFVADDTSKWVRNTAFQYLGQFLTVVGLDEESLQGIEGHARKARRSSSPGASPRRGGAAPDGAASDGGTGGGQSGGTAGEPRPITPADTVAGLPASGLPSLVTPLSPSSRRAALGGKVDENLLNAYQSMAYPDSSDRLPMAPGGDRMPTATQAERSSLASLRRVDTLIRQTGAGGEDDEGGGGHVVDPRPDPDDLAWFCAYALPGVAMALGPDRWEKSLRHVFLTLVENPQKRVRRTLAYSLHALAQILGPERSEKELLNAFDTLLHDIDEVRVGVVENLAIFLQALDNPCRESFLVVMSEILEGVGRRNWRFRLLLANQLGAFGTLFSPPATVSVVQSLVFKMLHDPVAVVRRAGAQWVGTIAMRLDGKFDWQDAFVQRLVDELGTGASYQQRLLFVDTCVVLKRDRGVREDVFERLCRDTLNALKADPVANVRAYCEQESAAGRL
jgi:serine/threonine-protein phosphatase 4 regulatory subunit 1